MTVIEYLDPECPACTIFQLEYGGYLDHLIGSGSIYYVIQYFPTHVLDYGCSSPTIEPMLGTICQADESRVPWKVKFASPYAGKKLF